MQEACSETPIFIGSTGKTKSAAPRLPVNVIGGYRWPGVGENVERAALIRRAATCEMRRTHRVRRASPTFQPVPRADYLAVRAARSRDGLSRLFGTVSLACDRGSDPGIQVRAS